MPKRGNPLLRLFSSSNHSSSSRNFQLLPPLSPPSSPPPQPPPLPETFICPISFLLMAHPVVVPTGHTFDRPFIQACIDLNLVPPHLQYSLTLPPPSSSTSTSTSSSATSASASYLFPLVSNLNLLQAILHWCRISGNPYPTRVSQESSRHYVKALMSMSQPPSIPPHDFSSIDTVRERWILRKLGDPDIDAKDSAMKTLLITQTCSPRILAAMIHFLITEDIDSNLQILAAKVMYKLSLNPVNRILIIRAGAIPHLISVIATGIRRASTAAAGTLYKLALEELNCAMIGALGAVPELLEKFCETFLGHFGRKEAALALYHLCLSAQNLEVLCENGGVLKLMEAAEDMNSPREMRTYALILVHLLMGLERGRDELLDREGGLRSLMSIVKEGGEVGLQSLGVMYKICKGSLRRFRRMGMVAGGEDVLVAHIEAFGELGKEMAKGMLKVMRGECQDDQELRKIFLKDSTDQEIVEVEADTVVWLELEKKEEEEVYDRKGKEKVTDY